MKFKRIIPVFFFLFLTLVFFNKYFIDRKIPLPADILLGYYHPWFDLRWEGRETIYPIKNLTAFDAIRQTFPWRILAIGQMKQGQLPLWNPYSFSGTPLMANIQTAAFYPLNLLFWFFSDLDAWSLYIISQVFLSGIFMFFFLKKLTGKEIPSYLGAVSWSLSVVMLNHLEFGVDGHTILWLPLALLMVKKLTADFNFQKGAILSFSIFMILVAGYLPPAIYALAVIFLYTVFSSSKRRLPVILMFIFIGIGLSSFQLLPTYQLVKKSVVAKEEVDDYYFFPAGNLLMTFAPDFFGHFVTRNFSSPSFYSDSPATGAVCFVFWSLTLPFLLRRKLGEKREIIFWWFLVLLPMVFMGNNVFGRFLRDSPIGFFRSVSPIKMIWIVSFSLSILGAFGIKQTETLLSKKKWLLSLMVPVLAIILIWFLSYKVALDIKVAQRNLILPTMIALLVLGGIFISFFSKKFWKMVCFLFIVAAAGELLRQGWKYTSFIDKELVFPKTKIINYLIENGDFRTITTSVDLFPSNTNIFYHLYTVDGYSSLRDKRYDYLVRLMDQDINPDDLGPYPRIIYQPKWGAPVADLLRVKYVLSLSEIDSSMVKLVLKEGETKLYEKREVFSQFFFVENYSVEKNIKSIARKMLTLDLRKEAVLEEPVIEGNLGVGRIDVISKKDNLILLKTINEKNGLLILTDTYDPGWKVFINGKQGEVLRANLNLRAVFVPAGNHEIKFLYFPDSLKYGLAISAGSFLIFLVCFVFRKKLE